MSHREAKRSSTHGRMGTDSEGGISLVAYSIGERFRFLSFGVLVLVPPHPLDRMQEVPVCDAISSTLLFALHYNSSIRGGRMLIATRVLHAGHRSACLYTAEIDWLQLLDNVEGAV